jgi:hypothetical protein
MKGKKNPAMWITIVIHDVNGYREIMIYSIYKF